MTNHKLRGLALGGLLALTSCSGDVADEGAAAPTVEIKEPIIRATAQGGRDQVVMLFMYARMNNQTYYRTCSGTYFAPRVVMTAAHCLQDAVVGSVYVYWGDNFASDYAAAAPYGGLPSIPPVGQASVWGHADSFEAHPLWSAAKNHPDIGAVYLDRRPPFDPVPLARFRLDDSWNGRTVTIMGWGADSAPTPTTGAGSRVERTGRTKVVGSPTLADYHPEDPNPALLVPANLPQIVKTDGNSPNSNACFGDSGGPIIVNQWGQDYAAGVSSFGGLSCESYSLYTRIDPFLPFLDEAYRKGGQAVLTPHLDCVAPNPTGGLTAFFGYANQNGVTITVPYGTKNYLPLDTGSRRATSFLPGTHEFTFGIDFKATEQVVYRLSPDNSPTTDLRVSASSRRCGAADATGVSCGGYCAAFPRSGCADLIPYQECMSECMAFATDAPDCTAEYNAMNQCYANTAAGAENWECMDGYPYPIAVPCADIEMAYYSCAYGV